MFRLFVLFLFSFGSLPLLLAQEGPRFTLSDDHRQLIIDQIPSTYWQQLTKVSTKSHGLRVKRYQAKNKKTTPAMLGRYERRGQQIIFRPVLPFQEGQSYVAQLLDEFTFHFSIPKKHKKNPSQLLSVFPSGKKVPANLLKVYLHFSQAMSEGQAYRHLSLVDQNGQEVEQAFLELYPELWDAERKRLTLWLDPGRIKRDLGPNQKAGSPMIEGQNYRLTIDRNWIDATGVPLAEDYVHQWQVEPANYHRLDFQQWQYEWPKPNSTDPLKISFGHPLDQVVLMKSFALLSMNGRAVAGHFQSSENERVLLFYPQHTWLPGKYHLQVAASLEDLSGNNLNRPFDLDLLNTSTELGDQEFYEQTFVIAQEK